MRTLISQLLALGPELATYILTSPILFARTTYAQSQQTIPSPNLDLGNLGRVALAGDFDSISLYQYKGQNENNFANNGSQALLSRYPDGSFRVVASADAYIMSMCPFVQDGSLQGIIVGGNFTRLGDQEAQGIALYNPETEAVTALPGLTGSVNAVYCDDSGTVFVGGSFSGANSSNAIAWTTGWNNLPFSGFNGPVTSITKGTNGNIVFGGDFSGLGNVSVTPNNPDEQVIALQSGSITSSGTAPTEGYYNASEIICKTAATDGPGNTWLLADNTAGWWQGEYEFGFNPTKIRLYNTMEDGRGTRSWYFENMNSGGIQEMAYFDENGGNQTCVNFCPLAQNSSAQDFHFTQPVGMNSFRIWITEWYGSGGGLAGIELFQDDIYSFAVNSFNQPQCDEVSNSSSSTANPSTFWVQTPNNGHTTSDYLTATITDASNLGSNVSVVFSPNIEQSGNYSITVYTPGCLNDNTCSTRGMVNLTGTMTSTEPPITTTLSQTNDYDKYDQIYYGYVDVSSGAFEPSVTLSPVAGQKVPLTVVAQRVRFELISSSGGLNGLYEYNPNEAVVSTDFSHSAIDVAGSNLDSNAKVMDVVTHNDAVFVAGNFSADGITNIMSIKNNATALANGGLNGEVIAMYLDGDTLYLGGAFTNTAQGSLNGLSGIAIYDTGANEWKAIGGGVNGVVNSIVPVSLNISAGNLQDCLTVNGDFKSVNGFGNNKEFSTNGFAVWVLSAANWLHNLPNATVAIDGQLVTMTTFNGSQALYAGQIYSQGLGVSGAVQVEGSGTSLQPLGIKIQSGEGSSSNTATRKRALTSSQNYTGVYTGSYFGDNNLNITILGGHFSATDSDGATIENLLFINNTATTQTVVGVSGLESDSTFMDVDHYNNILFAGGAVTGKVGGNDVNGLVAYDLSTNAYITPQPPALQGDTVAVYAVAVQPENSNVYVGGDFDSAGSLPCAVLCYYDAEARQWNSPATGIEGTITSMVWVSKSDLVITGNLTVGGNQTTMATYNADDKSYQEYQGANSLPGPIIALTPADRHAETWWAAGSSTSDGTAFLSKYTGAGTWTSVTGLGSGSSIRGLQLIPVSENHGNTSLMPKNMVLMVTGNINVPSFGNASAVLYDGSTFQPYVLTNTASGGQGSLSQIFVSNPQNFMRSSGSHLAVGLVVLVGLAIALGLIFLLVIVGILMERARRKREGYVPMRMDRNGNLQRIPPETLLSDLGEKEDVPRIR